MGKQVCVKNQKKNRESIFIGIDYREIVTMFFFFFFVQMQLGLFIAETAALSCSAGLGGAHPHTINQNQW